MDEITYDRQTVCVPESGPERAAALERAAELERDGWERERPAKIGWFGGEMGEAWPYRKRRVVHRPPVRRRRRS